MSNSSSKPIETHFPNLDYEPTPWRFTDRTRRLGVVALVPLALFALSKTAIGLYDKMTEDTITYTISGTSVPDPTTAAKEALQNTIASGTQEQAQAALKVDVTELGVAFAQAHYNLTKEFPRDISTVTNITAKVEIDGDVVSANATLR